MPKKKKQTPRTDDDLELEEPEKQERSKPESSGDDGDDDYDMSGLPSVADIAPRNEPDPREIDNMTDRIFDSVLSRFGWRQHEGRIEHVGETARQRR